MKKILIIMAAMVATIYTSAQQLPVGTGINRRLPILLEDSGMSAEIMVLMKT
ncbi:MAG: hypothetical protein R2809_07245 [Flavobacteriales bacterium]